MVKPLATTESGILAAGSVLFPSQSAPAASPLTQAEVNYVEKTPDVIQHCSICQHFLGSGACELVKPEPKAIMDQGWCDRYADVQVDEMDNQPRAAVKEQAMDEKGFIYLTIRWVWEIERIQSAFYTLFGYNLDWNWYSAYTYHITLAYCENVTDEQMLEAAKAAIGMTGFSVKFTGLGTFPAGDDQKTLYAAVEENEGLRNLQRAFYDSLTAQGVAVSEFNQPDGWIPHMSLALVPVDTAIPEGVLLDIYAYCNEVVLARDNYEALATVTLKYSESTYINPDEGLTPAVSPALETEKLTFGAHADIEVLRGDGAWNANQAVKAALESVSYGAKDTSASALPLAGSMFLVRDTAAPSLLTSYRHPFAELKDGKLLVTAESLRFAAASLAKDKSLSASAMEAALFELNRYKEKVGVGEMTKVRVTMVSEMKGEFPDIKTPEDIDLTAIAEITGGKAFFVTLPVNQAGARSNNRRTYSRNAVEQMVEQINDFRPYGGWGHMTEEELATDFDPPSVQCVAAMMDKDGTAWGKFLALNQETRDYYRMAKATNSKVATSLVGLAEMRQDEVINLDLLRIDIADPARIGVPVTVANPHITNEMAGDVFVKTRTAVTNEVQNPDPAVKPDALVEEQSSGAAGAASDGAGTSVPAADAVVTETERENKMQLTQEQIQALVTSEGALKTQVTELTSQIAALASEKKQWEETDKPALVGELNVLLGEFLVAEIDREVAVPSFRGMVKKQVLKAKPQSRDAIKAAVKEFLDDEDNQAAMKAQVVSESGPKQTSTNESLHTKVKADATDLNTLTAMEHFEFDPVDPAAPRALKRQMQEA